MGILEEKGSEVEIYKYLDENPDAVTIKEIINLLGVKPREMMRTKEDIYKDLGLQDVEDDAALIEAMAQHPKLIERPIIIKEGKAVIGRPPERVLDLI